MKKLLSIFFILLSAFSYGQNYYSFPTSDAVWNENFVWESQGIDDYFQFGLSGDTLLGGKIYHKIYSQDSCLSDHGFSGSNVMYTGAIREDSLKRIYFYSNGWTGTHKDSVYLLYDFSAQPGDTLHTGSGIVFPYSVLNSIDSVWAYDHYRKRYHLSNDTWIEGIGSISHLLSAVTPIPLCGCSNHLTCFKYGGTIYYSASGTQNCCGTLTQTEAVAEPQISITVYPNPIESYGTIDLSGTNNQIERIEIYNTLGKLIKVYSVEGRSKILIGGTGFIQGLYFFKAILFGQQGNFSGRFIIK